jgi:hypothetical protein
MSLLSDVLQAVAVAFLSGLCVLISERQQARGNKTIAPSLLVGQHSRNLQQDIVCFVSPFLGLWVASMGYWLVWLARNGDDGN